jgi:hypothetical protein
MKPKNNYVPGGQDVMLTPPHAIEPLLPLIPKDWTIWESACGSERIMENSFRQQGYNVVGTDICFSQDYFLMNDFEYDIEVTNVPFSLKYKWLEKAFNRDKPFAFIVPYETTFAKEFQMLFKYYHQRTKEINVLSPERRINYKTPQYGWGKKVFDEGKGKEVMKGNSAQMPTVWLTYGLPTPYTKFLKTYYVPMRSVKYDENNQEIK